MYAHIIVVLIVARGKNSQKLKKKSGGVGEGAAGVCAHAGCDAGVGQATARPAAPAHTGLHLILRPRIGHFCL